MHAARETFPPARNVTGHANSHGGVKTPPYREQERGGSTGAFAAKHGGTGGLQAAPTAERAQAIYDFCSELP